MSAEHEGYLPGLRQSSAEEWLKCRLIHTLDQFLTCFLAFTVTFNKLRTTASRQERELDQFLHHIDHPIIVWGRLHTVVFVKFQKGPGR